AVADAAQLVVAGVHHHSVPGGHGRHLGADLLHHPGHLVAEGHGGPARTDQPTHADVAEVGAADPAGRHSHHGVAWPGSGRVHVVEVDLAGSVHSDLLHDQSTSARTCG